VLLVGLERSEMPEFTDLSQLKFNHVGLGQITQPRLYST
jgi:hypothetical protein